ncbi:hypothetical protein LLEC1_05614 [Akanthomyces lecanii]|uniref:Aminoglycoside phosphotransferase domain-containing protein n=1 Tax=Cordyceps confragosa TaxID=2714763 RepID=A0A179I4V9_CORDF|nr:hypothetical protein LLEC1_05614 [Akanthomyces lecanii]
MDLIRALQSVWASVWSFVATCWRRVIYGTKSTDTELGTDRFPRPPKTTKEAADAFVQSLLPAAVKGLASRYNNGKACELLGRLYGSFNVCFFVKFEECGTEWVIRIPIEPRLHRPWHKLRSEVATLKYIRSHTTIPIPTVRAFGKDAVLTSDKSTTQMFLISDRLPGLPLKEDRLAEADDVTRRTFLRQLFEYLAQLRSLEFHRIGSLMPTTTRDPVIGETQSFSTNDLGIQIPSFTSARGYMLSQYNILHQCAARPVADYSEADCRYELFALDSLREPCNRFISESQDQGPFILHHPDLHLSNILVDDSLNIQGIVDWEFANTVPLQLFTPPLWAVQQEPGLEWLSLYFFTELYMAAEDDTRLQGLFSEWYPEGLKLKEAFYFARMLRHPADMTEVFSKHFAQTSGDLQKDLSNFFAQNHEAALEAERRASENARWTQFLLDNGMHVCDK